MKWEKKIDDLLIGKFRRDNVEVPTNILRIAKTNRQRLLKKVHRIELETFLKDRAFSILLDEINNICESKEKSRSKIEMIQNMIFSFIFNFDKVCSDQLESMKKESQKPTME